MRIVHIDPIEDPLWQRLVDHSNSSVFHSPEWLQVLTDTYGFDIRAIVKLDGAGLPQAGLPYGRISDFLGERIVVLPFSDYCDPLAEERGDWESLVETLVEERVPITIRPLHNDLPTLDARFTLTKQAKWHRVEVCADLDAQWSRVPDSARRAIAKARDNGVAVRPAEGPEELREFFGMHLGVRKYKYRLLAQPYRFFENIWQRFIEPGNGRLILAAYEERVIGGVLYLEYKDTLYYKFNASVAGDLPYRPNDLLMWHGIQYAKSRGCRWVDLGLSDWDQEGLIRYKRKYATEEKTISFLRHSPPDPAVRPSCTRELLSNLTGLFTEETVPDCVTERAGELLYRYFA